MLAWALLLFGTGFASKNITVRDPYNLNASLEDDRAENRCRPDHGKRMTFSPGDFEVGSGPDFCRLLRRITHGLDLEERCVVYDDRGQEVSTYENLKENTSVSVVPASLPFLWQSDRVGEILYVEGGPTSELIELETLSIEPRVYKIRNLLTEEEVDGFVEHARTKKMDRSTVGGVLKESTSQNAGTLDADRTSENTWDLHSLIALRVQKRVFSLLRVPFDSDWAEGFQILHYTPGQFYNSHEDWFDPKDDGERENRNYEPSLGGANRFATLFLYLSTVEIGGETVFPKGPDVEEDMSTRARGEALRRELVANGTIEEGGLEWHLFDTCRRKLHTKPVKGEVILFYNIDSRGVLDAKAQHGACAPLSEDKWGSNLWIWNGPYHLDEARTADFVNNLEEDVDVFWQSNTGEEAFLDVLVAGGKYQSFTFVDHTFVVKSKTTAWTFTIAEHPASQLFIIDHDTLKTELIDRDPLKTEL